MTGLLVRCIGIIEASLYQKPITLKCCSGGVRNEVKYERLNKNVLNFVNKRKNISEKID